MKNKMNISSSVALLSSAPHVSAPTSPSAALKRAARNWAARKSSERDRDQTSCACGHRGNKTPSDKTSYTVCSLDGTVNTV